MWQDIAAVEDTLSSLQKVGDELAANFGDRSFSYPGIVSAREISIVRERQF